MITALIDSVRAGFAARGFVPSITIDEGIDAVNSQTDFGGGGANRVCFSAAADPVAFGPPIAIGEDTFDGAAHLTARSLLTATVVFSVTISGYDATQPARDMAHRQACMQIFQVVAQEVQAFAPGMAHWSTATWIDDRKQVRFGAALVATLALDIPIFDTTSTEVSAHGVLEHPTEKAIQ